MFRGINLAVALKNNSIISTVDCSNFQVGKINTLIITQKLLLKYLDNVDGTISLKLCPIFGKIFDLNLLLILP